MFDTTAKVEVDRCRRLNRAGECKDALSVNFPSATAKTASRAMYFEVAAVADGKTFKMKRVSAKGFNRARRRQPLCTECVFALDELPQAVPFRFSVTPVAAFGSRGDPIRSGVVKA